MDNEYMVSLRQKVKVGKEVFIAPNATVLGDVTLGDNASVWYGAVIRADMDSISIGARTNVQDGVVFHTDPHKPVTVGEEVIIGHGAVIHGCQIGNNCLIGIRSTILNDAVIGNFCIIGAHALITQGMKVPDYSMVLGIPGKIVKRLPDEVIEKLKRGSRSYVEEAKKYLQSASS